MMSFSMTRRCRGVDAAQHAVDGEALEQEGALGSAALHSLWELVQRLIVPARVAVGLGSVVEHIV